MAQGFNMKLRCQQEWGWLIATWLFLSGSGSGVFLLYEWFDLPAAFALLSLATIVLGGAVLLWELGNPLRAWRGVSRLGTSWLSRGALSVWLFVVCTVLFLAPAFAAFSALPWGPGDAVGKALEWVAALCALVISLYPGFSLAKNRSIPFWNTALVPVISFGFALMGASGLVLVASLWLAADVRGVASLAGVLIVVNLLLTAVHLVVMQRAGGAAGESVRLLNRGGLGWIFWLGVVLVGMIAPLPAVALLHSAVALGGAGLLIGTLLFRYCVLKAGVYVPPALAGNGAHLARLKRISADLRHEYAGVAAQYARGRG
jgi:formate-dependent nitrite reductase membrane component NrfD